MTNPFFYIPEARCQKQSFLDQNPLGSYTQDASCPCGSKGSFLASWPRLLPICKASVASLSCLCCISLKPDLLPCKSSLLKILCLLMFTKFPCPHRETTHRFHMTKMRTCFRRHYSIHPPTPQTTTSSLVSLHEDFGCTYLFGLVKCFMKTRFYSLPSACLSSI